MEHEQDDDLSTSIEPRNEAETEEFPKTTDDLESEQLDAESDDETIVGQ
jgi:hypothetical protein